MGKIILPVAFSEAAQLILFTRYGDPRVPGWEQRWMTDWFVREHFPWFPQERLYVHKHFKILLENAFRELELLGLMEEVGSVSKCHLKKSDAKGLLSLHSWGAAIDMLPKNQSGKKNNSWSKEFIHIMNANDIWCGQNTPPPFAYAHRFCMVDV
ncbi:MAG TPA: hypothetical protein VL098_01195 [Flavipsychrobacter sp.]|nr:hypothetical protein [Flavipsychrobacter sp.]